MLLKRGDNNDNVKKLQEKLGLDPVGNFGPKTEEAVKAFQSKNGLIADGVVGDKTWNAIMGGGQPAAPAAPVAAAAAPAAAPAGLNINKLKGHIPDNVIAQIPEVIEKFQINTAVKLAHFLAQCGHESAGFKATSENLNYSAKGLLGIFKKYFPTQALAEQYQRKPEAIASRVYGGRMGNGPESTKEGYKFRGRGYIQLTGKDNYSQFDKVVPENLLENPDLVSTKYPLLSAAWFFHKNCLKRCVDASDATVTSVTKCVNGGTIGLPDRLKHFKEYYNLLK